MNQSSREVLTANRKTVSRSDRRRACLPAALVTLMIVFFAMTIAPPTGASTSVPSLTLLPSSPSSMPYGSNDPGVADLASVGYVQEEYLMSGMVQSEAGESVPYTTRMLVRRPARPAHFSGTVIVESLRSSADRSMWGLRDYITRSGHAYVEIGSNTLAINNIVVPSDPERYDSLEMPAFPGALFGHVLELMAQGGVALKENLPPGPFDEFEVDNVILGGCSEQGLVIRLFMRDGHPVYRTAWGEGAFDGYFPACVADWPEFIPFNGGVFRNFTPGPIDVPVINLLAQTEFDSWPYSGHKYRRPDSDGPDDFYRIYEVAAMQHGIGRPPSAISPCTGQPTQPFPAHHVAANALDKLIQWVDQGIVPPRADPLVPDGSGLATTDPETGIAIGGVRTVTTDVPIGRYSSCLLGGFFQTPFLEELFTRDELAQRYGAPGQYVAQVNRTLAELVREGWYLREDTREVRAEAVGNLIGWVQQPHRPVPKGVSSRN